MTHNVLADRRDPIGEASSPNMTPGEFVAMFCATHKGCTPETEVTRIEFEYVGCSWPRYCHAIVLF
jgi:hypothetical protein